MITIYITCFILIVGLLVWYYNIEDYTSFIIKMHPVFGKNDVITSGYGLDLQIVGYKTKGEYIVKLVKWKEKDYMNQF